jgi:DnaJ-domain-containing protein 1
MTDYFQLFNEVRRPWIEQATLKQKFLAKSAAVHPDRVHLATASEQSNATDAYTELNTAYQTLREPKDRLLHLLTLESGAKPRAVQTIAGGSMQLFVKVAGQCQAADKFLAERTQATSPLVKVQFFAQSQDWIERLSSLQQEVQKELETLYQDLQGMNKDWEEAPVPGSPLRLARLPMARLEEIYRALSYINKWNAELRERLVQLAI